MKNYEEVDVEVNGELHTYAADDVTIRPLIRPAGSPDEAAEVEVNYAGKKISGTVTAKRAKKLRSYLMQKWSKEMEAEREKDLIVLPKKKLDKPIVFPKSE